MLIERSFKVLVGGQVCSHPVYAEAEKACAGNSSRDCQAGATSATSGSNQ
jgi:hypothetical protein